MKTMKWIRRAAAAVMCALLALSTAACSQPVNMESGVITQDYPVTINEVTIDAKPQKVAVLSGSLADVVLAMGYETSLALASEDCTQPELEVLTKISATDSAAILNGGVDLVLAETMDDATRAALEEAGVKVLLLNRAANREDFERLYSEVGSALNGTSTGATAGVKAAQNIFSSLDDLARLVPESTTVVTACYISDLSGQAVTGDELGSVMMSYMGLTNIFKGRTGGTFTYEDLKLSDPTMIFCTEAVRTQILADTQYAELTAVKNGRVYAIDPHYMEWQGRTVYTAALEMMGLAYPELTESSEPSVTMELGTAEPSPSASPAPEYKALKQGDESSEVLAMQERLAALGYLTEEYDGMYGEVTAASVSAFQSGNGLEETGEADAETLAKLFSDEAVNTDGEAVPMPSASASPTPSPAPEGDADTGSTAATDDAPPSGAAGGVGPIGTHDGN